MIGPHEARVYAHRALNADFYWLELDAPEVAERAHPGQFAHVACGEASYLRRAFSFSSIDSSSGRVALLYRVVGEGTAWLAGRRPGDCVNLLAPLGRGFPTDVGGVAILVGGGTGVAPLIPLAARLTATGRPALALVGARRAADLVGVAELREAGAEVRVATDDGSYGFHGTVVDLLAATVPTAQGFAIYSCGPTGMLRAVQGWSLVQQVPAWLSLETPMACGIGICLACTVEGPRGSEWYHRACWEGPVFPAQEVVI